MPKQGQILQNPLSGDTFEFIETAASSNGERVVIKSTVKRKGLLVPNHMHVLQDEQFDVISGTLTYYSDGKISTAGAGKTIILPKNKSHNHYNSQDEPLVYIHTVTPALDFEYLIENLVGLAADGKMKNGKAGLVQELVTLKYLDSKAYLTDIPVGVQKLLINIIAPVARRFGYRAVYRKYSEVEK
ncbi:MAG TPA: cupin domain-containing protein [Patescibacteria group bacterium]|nr:cupin domain-containing protein [Patescibacteria group bacterium]